MKGPADSSDSALSRSSLHILTAAALRRYWLPLALPARSNGVPARLMLLPKRGVGCESRNGGKEKGK